MAKPRTRRVRRNRKRTLRNRKQRGGNVFVEVKIMNGKNLRPFDLPDGSTFQTLKQQILARDGVHVYKGIRAVPLKDTDILQPGTIYIQTFSFLTPRSLVTTLLLPHPNISSIQKMKPMANFNSLEAGEIPFSANWKNYTEEQRQESLTLLSERLGTPIGTFENHGIVFYSIPHVSYICTLYGISLEEGLAKFNRETLDLSFIYICFGDIAGLSTDPQPITALTPEARAIYETYQGTDDEQIRAMMGM